MSKTYPKIYRDKAIQYYEKSQNKSKTAELYGITRKTLDSWIQLKKEQGHTNPKPSKTVGVKPIIQDLQSFEKYVKQQQFDTAKQLREQYLKDHLKI